jgi:uncharacterized glyoxalase superfamily protein PhnB
MAGKTNRIPEGFHTITPHIVLRNAAQAIEFYKRAFGAEEISRAPGPDAESSPLFPGWARKRRFPVAYYS